MARDYNAELLGAEQQRKTAQLLRQQASQTPQGGTYGGWYVAPSPLQYLGQLAQQYVAKSDEEKAAQQEQNIATAKNKELAGLLKSYGQTPSLEERQRLMELDPNMGKVMEAENMLRQKQQFQLQHPQGGNQPYFTSQPTTKGYYTLNARTGEWSPAVVGGQPLIPPQYDPTRQSELAQSKSYGTGQGTAESTLAGVKGSLPQLTQTVNDLKDLSKKATFTLAGQARDAVARQFGHATEGAINREKYISTVRDVLFPLLRQTFGAQFTVSEGEALISTLGDPNKTPEERSAALDTFIEQKKRHMKGLQGQLGQTPSPSQPTVSNW